MSNIQDYKEIIGIFIKTFMVEFKHEGVPRNLSAHKVEGSIRYRLVDAYKSNKLGKWTITIKKGLTVLRTFDVNVIDK